MRVDCPKICLFFCRTFTTAEKEKLLAMYKFRCSIRKDYRFCVSHAAYELGDRGISQVTHVWARLNPDIQKGPFTTEEDAILLREASDNPTICWTTLASAHLPDRSGLQCRHRYLQLVKLQSAQTTTKPIRPKVGFLQCWERFDSTVNDPNLTET